MEDRDNSNIGRPETGDRNLLALKEMVDIDETDVFSAHKFGKGHLCRTDARLRERSPLALVLHATEGFIPLWDKNLVLRWRFNEASLAPFQKPVAIKEKLRLLLGKAISLWGEAAPIRFVENSDNSDFEIFVKQQKDCTAEGCTLAQAFFPDAGRHPLYIFPSMFEEDEKEQVDTLTHEIGHVFGLRHFFAPENETEWPSVVFGVHKPFSIMSYGGHSEMTDDDRKDLARLYESAWSGQLTNISGTPIKFVRPYHYLHA